MKIAWWTFIFIGLCIGFGAAAGVMCFLMVSDNAMVMYRYLRQLIYRLVKWRNAHGNEPRINQ